jgi:hypothetical protein
MLSVRNFNCHEEIVAMSGFPNNIEIQKNYPAVQYEPNDPAHEPAGVWHEDHEIDGAMYRAANASFDDANTKQWFLKDMNQPAYARVQNTDGSTSYLYMPANSPRWLTPAWLGTGQPVMYHVANYGMSPSNTDVKNQQALQAALTAAHASGGIVYIPAGTYQINGTVSLPTVPGNDNGIIVAGAGGSTTLVQTSLTADTFSFNGLKSGRGVRIRDLFINYPIQSTVPSTIPVAVRVVSSQNVTCERVFFLDCLQALNLGNNAQQCGLLDCTIQYANIKNQTMVVLGGVENYIDNCTIRQTAQGAKGGPIGCTGVLVAPEGGGVYIANTHISDFTIGIAVQENGGQNYEHAFLSSVVCESWETSLLIKPTSGNGLIFQVACVDCVFAASVQSDSTSTGVYIGTSGGANEHVTDIFLNNCVCYQGNGPGVEINRGRNIVITGGRYSSNALQSPNSGGIAITGTAADITINGADCTPILQSSPGLGSQPHAISITASVAGLYVRNCNLNGYTTQSPPVYANSAGTQIQITNCPGYNDQNTPITTTVPIHSGIYAASPGSGGTPYYGPSIVTFANGNPPVPLQVIISQTQYTMSFGSIYLPRQIDEIWFQTAPANFTWLGK